MCGEFMRLVVRESIEHVPGLPETSHAYDA